jgi:hypothetical protein
MHVGGWTTCFQKRFTKRKNKNKKCDKKKEKRKKGSNLWAIYQCLQIECNLTWARLLKP